MSLFSVMSQRLANLLRTFPCFATLQLFLFCSNLDLNWPIALPSLTASVLSRQRWDSQEGETHHGRQEGRSVRMPSPPPPLPPGGTVSFAFTSQALESPMASRAFQSESIDGKATSRQRGEGGVGGWVVGGPTSLCQRGDGGWWWWACLLEGPASAALERTRHQRPPSLTAASPPHSSLGWGCTLLHLLLSNSPAIAIWLWNQRLSWSQSWIGWWHNFWWGQSKGVMDVGKAGWSSCLPETSRNLVRSHDSSTQSSLLPLPRNIAPALSLFLWFHKGIQFSGQTVDSVLNYH